LRISLLFILLSFLFVLNTHALLRPESNYKWWKDPKIASELDLSKDQVGRIERIFSSYKKIIVKYKKQLSKGEVMLKKELQNPNAKKEDVLNLIDAIEHTKAKYTRSKVEMFLRVREVLTPEQVKTLHTIKLRFKPYHR